MEIERKFLVEQLPADLRTHPSDRIEQGYIVVTEAGLEVRLRSYGEHFFLTIKSGVGEVRLEEEIEIDAPRFRSLWALTEGRRICKRRYRIPHGSETVIELDDYEGTLSGLVVAEVEFASLAAADAFTSPPWFGGEITDDPEYKNNRLALDGLPRSFARSA